MNSRRPLVSLVLPAFNEAAVLRAHLDELVSYVATLASEHRFEFIVVNDGSTDDTAALAEAYASDHPQVKVFHHTVNRGLGAALRTAFGHAAGDVILALDVDLSYEPEYIGVLLATLKQSHADIVVASPYMKGGTVSNVPWMRKQMSAWANRYLSIAAGGKIVTLTGMVRAYDARALRRLTVNCDGMDINHELIFAAQKLGMRIVEVPAALHWRAALASQPAEPSNAPRRSSMRIAAHIWSVLASGLRHRPAMLLAIPGLIPGLLPLVLMVLVVLRPSHAVIVNTTVVTITIQSLSLAFLGLLTGSYVRQLRSIASRAPLPHSGNR